MLPVFYFLVWTLFFCRVVIAVFMAAVVVASLVDGCCYQTGSGNECEAKETEKPKVERNEKRKGSLSEGTYTKRPLEGLYYCLRAR